MTKLLEWLAVFVPLGALWLHLVTSSAPDAIVKQYPNLILFSPIIFVGLFGVYAALVVMYRVLTFNDCEEAAVELKQEIEEAKSDLMKRGFKFRTEMT